MKYYSKYLIDNGELSFKLRCIGSEVSSSHNALINLDFSFRNYTFKTTRKTVGHIYHDHTNQWK